MTSSSMPFIVGIGGTGRPNSTSELAARRALALCEALGARTQLFDGQFITGLPLYSPGRDGRTAGEREWVDAIRRCDGIIVSTSGYHGGVTATIKNALDLLEDTAGDERAYLSDRAFGCIVSCYGWQTSGTTLTSLRITAHALRAWPTPFGVALDATRPLFGSDGSCIDEAADRQLAIMASQVVTFAQRYGSDLPAPLPAAACTLASAPIHPKTAPSMAVAS